MLPPVIRSSHRAAFRGQADTPLVADNRVSLLIDGPQTLAAIRKAIEVARHHVHIETYIFADDEVGRAFSELLIARHRDGIEVRVLYDAVGSVANLDMRSFLHNNEVNAVIVGSEFARRVEQVFERDLKETRELSLESWRQRPFTDKLKEFGSSLFSYWL